MVFNIFLVRTGRTQPRDSEVWRINRWCWKLRGIEANSAWCSLRKDSRAIASDREIREKRMKSQRTLGFLAGEHQEKKNSLFPIAKPLVSSFTIRKNVKLGFCKQWICTPGCSLSRAACFHVRKSWTKLMWLHARKSWTKLLWLHARIDCIFYRLCSADYTVLTVLRRK